MKTRSFPIVEVLGDLIYVENEEKITLSS